MSNASLVPSPVFGVLPRDENGCDTLAPGNGGKELRTIERGVFPVPFQTAYPWDAHFVQYRPTARDQALAAQNCFDPNEPFFRFNKPVLGELRAMGIDLVCGLLVLDWDTGTGQLTDALLDGFWVQWAAARDAGCELTKSWRLIYTTRGGLRVVYVLDKPIPVDEFEQLYRGVLAVFTQHGIRFDPACADWTRLFRLPRVTRDGVPQDALPTFLDIWNDDPNVTLATGSVARLGATQQTTTGGFTNTGPVGARPTPEECYAIMTAPNGGPSPFATIARRWLTGRESFEIAFKFGFLDDPKFLARVTQARHGAASESARHDALRFVICQAATLICPYAEEAGLGVVGPEHIYALFLKAIEQLPQERDWFKEAWDLCVWAWRREESQLLQKRATKVAEEKAAEEDKRSLEEKLIDRIREWDPSLPQDPQEAWPFVEKRLLILHGRGHWSVMGRTGRYEGDFVSRDGLVAKIEALGMESVIPTRFPKQGGGMRLASVAEITKDRLTNVGRIELAPNIGASYLKNLSSAEPSLVQESYARRTDLTPTYSPEVDEWLMCFAGKSYDRLCEYLAKCLAVGPLPGIALIGASGAGKGLLVRGLVDCFRWRGGVLATGEDLAGAWNEALAHSPLVVVNEGWPVNISAGGSVLDIARKLVSGDHLAISQKFKDKAVVTITPRLILCANNVKILYDLCQGRELRPEDRIALAQRFVFVDVQKAAAELLSMRGGFRYTADWVSGNQAVGYLQSSCTLAKHIFWLYEQRGKDVKVEGRFLMQGDTDSHVVRLLRTQGGSTPIVIEVVVDLVESIQKTDGSQGVKIHIPEPIQNGTMHYTPGTLAVQKSAIMNRFRAAFYKTSPERLTIAKLDAALHGLLAGDVHGTGMEEHTIGSESSWVRLDARLLLEQAQLNGWQHRRLESIVSGRPLLTVLNGGAGGRTVNHA